MELRNALNDKFGVELSPTVTLDYPSIIALAGHLAAQLPQTPAGDAAAWDHEDEDIELQVRSDSDS